MCRAVTREVERVMARIHTGWCRRVGTSAPPLSIHVAEAQVWPAPRGLLFSHSLKDETKSLSLNFFHLSPTHLPKHPWFYPPQLTCSHKKTVLCPCNLKSLVFAYVVSSAWNICLCSSLFSTSPALTSFSLEAGSTPRKDTHQTSRPLKGWKCLFHSLLVVVT